MARKYISQIFHMWPTTFSYIYIYNLSSFTITHFHICRHHHNHSTAPAAVITTSIDPSLSLLYSTTSPYSLTTIIFICKARLFFSKIKVFFFTTQHKQDKKVENEDEFTYKSNNLKFLFKKWVISFGKSSISELTMEEKS